MRIKLLDEVERDLIDGFAFYERQSKGLGEYCFDSIFADMESLSLHAGIHGSVLRLSSASGQTIPLCRLL
ncbi:conserved hypothetical protein [Syntrophobacter sp. SbD1]|nr:conserved hypothetical protein [Syntrophobacter sp. SbD1]